VNITIKERQAFRLNILKTICELTEFNTGKIIYISDLVKELDNIDGSFLNGELLYLSQEGYIRVNPIQYVLKSPIVIDIRINSSGIKLIELINNQKSIEEYEKHFSKESVEFYLNKVTNSNIIINSPNASIVNSENNYKELLKFFERIIQNEEANTTLKNLSENAIKEIKNGTASQDYLRGIGQALISTGSSLICNLLTPLISNILGIPM
jgi:hypothetical protein